MTGETTPDSGRISSALSLERLAPYLAESKNDSAAAVELYAWNMTIAELNFGFWRYLLARRYEATLWTPALRHAFPNLAPRSRTTVYRSVSELHLLRNRIAHHEPIHRRNLMLDALNMYRLLDWIDTDMRVWAVGLSRIQPLIASRPGQ